MAYGETIVRGHFSLLTFYGSNAHYEVIRPNGLNSISLLRLSRTDGYKSTRRRSPPRHTEEDMSTTSSVQSGQRYAFVQRLLHWLIALIVLGSLAGGAILWAYGFEGLNTNFGEAATNAVYKYHKTGGVLILGLMILRLVFRLAYGAPPTPVSLSPTVAKAAHATHYAFYALLILMPIVGWAATAAGGFPIEFFDAKLPPLIGKKEALSETLYQLHGMLGFIIGALALLHIAAALRHWLILRDGVMQRIGLP